jgi:hypothetical protein
METALCASPTLRAQDHAFAGLRQDTMLDILCGAGRILATIAFLIAAALLAPGLSEWFR